MYPTVHGDTVVFSYAGDLWSSKIDGGEATRLTSGYGPKAYPSISPDGSKIAFTAAYDGTVSVYTIPIEGGEPKRLTFDATGDGVLGWTPDGKIAYRTASYSPYLQRQQELFTVEPNGGMPEPTPVKEVFWASYFPNGHEIAYTRRPSFYYNWRRYRGGTQGVVSIYDMKTNEYSELPHGREQQYYPMVVGDDIYFVSDKTDGVLNLYRYNLGTKSVKKLTEFVAEDIKWANTDGKRIAFTQDGFLWVYDIASGNCHTISPVIHTDALLSRPRLIHATPYIRHVTVSPSGVRLAVEARGEIFSLPAHSGETRDLTSTSGAREQEPEWSPDGQTIAYLSDATGETEIYTRPQMGGEPTQITNLKKTITGYAWAPDGKMFLAQTIDNGLYVIDVPLKKATLVKQSLYGLAGADISPDSKWIAFTDGKSTGTAVLKLYNIASKTTTDVTDGFYADSDVAFDMNGKYLYLVSARTFTPTPGLFGPDLKVNDAQRIYALTLAKDTADPFAPSDDEEPAKEDASKPPAVGPPAKPGGPPSGHPPMMGATGAAPDVKIDLDGLAKRIVPLPLGASNYGGLVGSHNGVFFSSAMGYYKFDFGTKTMVPVINGPIVSLSFNPTRTMIGYLGLGGVVGVVPASGGAQFGQGRVDTSSAEFTLDPRAEWKQIYWEAWRFIRDHYYDVNFRGQNWRQIGTHYASWLKYCSSRNDVNVILNLLLSELGTSHAYLEAGGDIGPAPTPVSIGCLGADYKVENNAVRIVKIYRGETDAEENSGPLGLPGIDVKEGDYLLAIDEVDLNAHTPPATLLLDKAGKYVTLTVNSVPSKDGARKVRVRPIGNELQLRYLDFLERSRALVDKESGGRLGYMHIRDTAQQGSEDFARSYNALTDKEGLVIDERWNGGGYPDPKFVETLAEKNYSFGQDRNGADVPITASIVGPMALLINSYAGSGGDLFPWTFKQAGLGPLIGMRTWGGLVGIGAGADLVDGGSISTPSFSIYEKKSNEIIAENHGVDPDIEVDNRPDLVIGGKDPQLEAAIKYLMDKLSKMPPAKPRIKLPSVNKQGQIGK